ncbi:tRNA (guanine(37)-N1)-methyltransferase [Chelonus insularis]|uniref:tRNA (guanine(37)-N1)-methyltransferase n=1 Tax=Chelonus insularis TaxID=460826 RepID=UPI00158F0A23|nr:tRNA (guanine(37)-N1)-methyltransferase [Chelonus insularis]
MFRGLIINCLRSSTSVFNYSKNSKKMVYSLVPPDCVLGMTVLDREAFTSTIEVPSFNLGTEINHSIMPVIKKYILKLRAYKSVNCIKDDFLIYLDPEKVESLDDIDETDRKQIMKYVKKIDKVPITIHYNNWSVEKILRAVLPQDVEIPSSFTKVGHILHLNLRDNQLPFKNLIGQVYLDCVPHTKTVVNKLNVIDTEFRNFQMEILAGDDNTVTTVKENKCQFTFDFAKVYWNSRLSTEHSKLLEFMNKEDVLYDVFAGVGPFAVPAAKKGVEVLANDLNPESFKWLEFNVKANKAKNINCFNKDGRDFLKKDVKTHLLQRRKESKLGNEHIAMNLPAIANEFLDVFRNWVNEEEIDLICKNSPLIHLYCFVKVGKDDDPAPVAQSLVEDSLGIPLTSESLKTIHYVRNVAPNKEMMRVSFYLTDEMIKCGEPVRKKSKIENESNPLNNKCLTDHNGQEQENVKTEKECVHSTN